MLPYLMCAGWRIFGVCGVFLLCCRRVPSLPCSGEKAHCACSQALAPYLSASARHELQSPTCLYKEPSAHHLSAGQIYVKACCLGF